MLFVFSLNAQTYTLNLVAIMQGEAHTWDSGSWEQGEERTSWPCSACPSRCEQRPWPSCMYWDACTLTPHTCYKEWLRGYGG